MSKSFKLFIGAVLFLSGIGIHENIKEVTSSVFGCALTWNGKGSDCLLVDPQSANIVGAVGWLLMVTGIVFAATAFLRKDA